MLRADLCTMIMNYSSEIDEFLLVIKMLITFLNDEVGGMSNQIRNAIRVSISIPIAKPIVSLINSEYESFPFNFSTQWNNQSCN